MTERALKIAIVSGEESGDLLGADLVRAISRQTGQNVELCGVGGRHLQALGLKSLFDPADIALMGLTGVLKDLPRLAWRIRTTAKAIAAAKPDVLITVDSPAFTLRVASRLRAIAPAIPIVKYVCPSVWAWGPWRARRMKPSIDLILCLLPFEVDVLKRLDGPKGVYVGHRLASDPIILEAARQQTARGPQSGHMKLLVLPGSRRSEVNGLLKPFGETLSILADRGHELRVAIPTVPNVEALVRAGTADWPVKPEITTDAQRKGAMFAEADSALAASGTVLLELALGGVPMISCYRSDRLMRLAGSLITTWSAALPNLIADRVLVSEFYDEFVRPGSLARQLESLSVDSPARRWQIEGFATIRDRMRTDRPSSELAAEAVVKLVEQKSQVTSLS